VVGIGHGFALLPSYVMLNVEESVMHAGQNVKMMPGVVAAC